MPLFERFTSDLSLEQGHSIIALTSKPHDMTIEKAIQVFALKGLALPTLHLYISIINHSKNARSPKIGHFLDIAKTIEV